MPAKLDAARERWPLLDHLLRTVARYGRVGGSLQAGAITYFGFLAVFPLLALGFFVVGYLAQVYPDARADLAEAIDTVLPGIVGEGEHQLSLTAIEENAGAIGALGLLGVLYAGLGWVSAMREALQVVFAVPRTERPSFVAGKLRDLVSLVVIGTTLMVSIAVSGVITGLSGEILELVGLEQDLWFVLSALSVVFGVLVSMLLFYGLFRLLARPHLPGRALWSGALLGALGFEVLKQLSSLLLRSTQEQPAFQAFGIALILVVWVNYFSRVVIYAAAWACTSRPEPEPEEEAPGGDGPAELEPVGVAAVPAPVRPPERGWAAPFAGGAAAMLGVVALVRRRKRD